MPRPAAAAILEAVLRPARSDGASTRLRATAFGVAGMAFAACATAVLLQARNADIASAQAFLSFWPFVVVGGAAYSSTGCWLAAARPRERVGWLLLGIGATLALGALTMEYAVAGVGADWPLVGVALWLSEWIWVLGYLAVALLLPLLLPDGRLASPRHRPLLALALAVLSLTAAQFALTPYDRLDTPLILSGYANPLAIDVVLQPGFTVPLTALTLVSLVGGLAVLVSRWRHAGGDRGALSWIVLGLLVTVVLAAAAFPAPDSWKPALLALATVALPVSCVAAVLRYRLWDVEVVLSRSLAYAVLSVLVVVLYVALVGALGGVLGSTAGVPVLATVVVAVVVATVHGHVQRVVNRLVHGESEAPDVLLARLGVRMQDASDPAEAAAQVVPDVAERLRRLLDLDAVRVLGADGTLISAAPADVADDAAVSSTSIPLVYAGKVVGTLDLGGRVERMSAREQRLIDGVIIQLAVLVHAADLARQLRSSRERLVTGREDERRRLHRELHDGLGPTLAAAALQVEAAREVYSKDPAKADAMLDRATVRLRSAVEDVRAVVSGLRPPPLDELGLTGALEELVTRFDAPGHRVVLCASALPDRSAAVDVATYLVAAEALTNAVRHGAPTLVQVSLSATDAKVVLTVCDDGLGMPDPVRPGVGLRSMEQRAEELGGTLDVGPGAGQRGTSVVLRLPVRPT